jgi:hypothetical protein
MLKIKEAQELGTLGPSFKEQAEAPGKLKDFGGWLRSKMKGESGTESHTEIVVLTALSELKILEKVRKEFNLKKPNIFVLDEEKNPKFQQMLEGKIGIDECLTERIAYSKRYGREFYRFVIELHKKGVEVEQLSPPQGWLSAEMIKKFERQYQDIFTNVEQGNFEGAVGLEVNTAKMQATMMASNGKARAAEIAEKIRSGEWSGDILVMSGAAHRLTKYLLMEELKDMNVRVKSDYAAREAVSRVFGPGISDVSSPQTELLELYEHGIQPTPEREKLLAARNIIRRLIQSSPADSNFAQEVSYARSIKLANQLGYEECRALFSEIKDMFEEVAFEFVDAYLDKRGGIAAPRKIVEGGFTLGGVPIKDFKISKEKNLALVKCRADDYEITINDRKEVFVGWNVKKGFLKKSDRLVSYSDIWFKFESDDLNVDAIMVEQKKPYLIFSRDFMREMKDAGVVAEREDLWNQHLVGLKELREAVKLEKEGKLKSEKAGIEYNEKILEHEGEITKAAEFFEEAKKLRNHPQVEEIFEKRLDRFVENMKKGKAAASS